MLAPRPSPAPSPAMSPILVLVFLAALIACLLRYARSRPPKFPPGPARLPVWGNLWQVFAKNYRYPQKALLALAKDFGSPLLGLFVGPYPTVVANDYETVRDMLAHPAFQGRPDSFLTRSRAPNFNSHGVFFVDGDYWGQQRRFALRHMRDHGFGRRFEKLESVVLEEVQGVMQVLRGCLTPHDEDVARGGRVLLPDVFEAASMNTLLAVMTGTRMPADQFPAARVVARYAMDFQRAGNAGGGVLDATPWLRFLVPGGFGYQLYKNGNDNLLTYMAEHMQQQKGSFDAEMIRGFCDKFLLEMKSREGENSSFTEVQLALTLVDFMFPTATAVPTALSFAIVFMMQHPDIAERAHQEIKDVVGLDRLPGLDDRVNLPYTEACLRETLRMTGTPLTVMHRATEDSYFRGYYVPKDSLIVPNLWAAHHDPRVFEKPFEFCPDRFLQPHNGQLKRKDWSVPFGLGKRLCAGETFARQNMFLFLAALLQGFRFSMPDGAPVPDLESEAEFGFIMTLPDDFWVEVTERSS